MKAVEIKNLSKYYNTAVRMKKVCALDNVSFEVEEASIFGLLGANGAGKSTTIKILIGLIKKYSGEFKIFGKTMSKSLRENIGYLPENPSLYPFLNAYETLVLMAQLCGMSKSKARAESVKFIDLVGLANDANRKLSEYSKGMLQRVAIAQAIIHNPRLVILDEPASGLDPISSADIVSIILNLKAEQKTVILCSHSMSEVEKLCDDIVIMSRSKVLARGALTKLLEKPDTYNMELSNCSKENILDIEKFAKSQSCIIENISTAREPLDNYFENLIRGNK
ncbi:MAG: ABC transporter ATP-binding protein [Opitutales bacterium]